MNNTIFRKDSDNPVIRPEPGTRKHERCTSVTPAFRDTMCYFYHDGRWCMLSGQEVVHDQWAHA